VVQDDWGIDSFDSFMNYYFHYQWICWSKLFLKCSKLKEMEILKSQKTH